MYLKRRLYYELCVSNNLSCFERDGDYQQHGKHMNNEISIATAEIFTKTYERIQNLSKLHELSTTSVKLSDIVEIVICT